MQNTLPEKQVIVVIGARSGTSALSGTLSLLGADLPQNLMQANWANPKGYFEPQDIAELHDEILASLGSNWSDWRPIPPEWFQSEAARLYADRLAAMFLNDYQATTGLCVLKEPRMCRLLPLWQAVFQATNTIPLYCFIDRAPEEVAASLAARDGSSREQGLLYYLRNHIDPEQATRGARRAFVQYEALLADWRGIMAHVGQALGIPFSLEDATAAKVNDFLERALKHQTVEKRDPDSWCSALAESVHRAFTLFTKDPNDPVALAQMDHARIVFAMRAQEIAAP